MKILVVGDFGGTRPSARPLRPLVADPDEPSLARLSARATAGAASFAVRSVDDFLPDRLAGLTSAGAALLAARTRLAEGDAGAAEEVTSLLGETGGRIDVGSAAPGSDEPPSAIDLLASVLSETGARKEDDAAEALVRATAMPGIQRIRDTTGAARRQGLLAAADQRLSELVRAVLGSPHVRELEATWRGLDLLVRAVVSVEDVSVRVVDLSRTELDADVGVAGPLAGELHRHLVEEAPDAPRADLVLCAFGFDRTPRDVATLLRLARIADAGSFALLAGASDALAAPAADEDANALWRSFRRLPEASRVALCWPRVLLRSPYGRENRRTELFDFEESPQSNSTEFAWGHAGFAVAAILARSFEVRDGGFQPVDEPELAGLPAVTRRDEDGEVVLVPCTETRPTRSSLQSAADAGVLALLPAGDAAAVRLASLASAADPARSLRCGT